MAWSREVSLDGGGVDGRHHVPAAVLQRCQLILVHGSSQGKVGGSISAGVRFDGEAGDLNLLPDHLGFVLASAIDGSCWVIRLSETVS